MPGFTKNKWFRRFQTVFWNALATLLPPLTNIGLAWWVIEQGSDELWGAFVDPLIFAGITLQILSWGNKEFLLRAFAMRPDVISILFKRSLVSRAMLLFMVLPVVFLSGWSMEVVSYMLLWVFAGFLRHSFDVVVVYRKAFRLAVLVELGAILVLILGIWFNRAGLQIEDLIRAFAFAQVFRALCFSAIYGSHYLSGAFPKAQFRFFSTAMPFFLLGFAGTLVTRTDLICVSFWMDDTETGHYQIFINLLIYIQAGAGFILYPFAKNLYRLPDKSILKISLKILVAGIGLCALGIPAMYLILQYGFKLQFDWWYFLLAGAYVIPIYFYSGYIFLLFKHKEQKQVLLANFGAVLLNIAFNLVLIPSLGIAGALIGSVASQWFILVMLMVYVKMKKAPQHIAS